METLAWLEATGFSIWMRESGLAFFGSLVLHALGMAFIVGAHVATDLRLLGFAPTVPLSRMRGFRPVARVSLLVVTASGGLLLAAYPTKALTNPLFYVKLLAVGAAILVGRTLWVGVMRDEANDSGRLGPGVRALAALSIVLWFTAITSGRFLAYTYSVLMATDALPYP
jgi:hypothetical protein